MKTVIYNIGTLAGILPESKTMLKGEEMNHVECIENAYLTIEDGIITDFGPCNGGYIGIQNRATPLAAGGGARDAVVGGVLFDAGHSERAVHNICERLSVLIVGLGGAGKAAVAAAESLGMDVVRMNRTVRDEKTRPLEDFRECFREADIVIYNIPTVIPQLNELTDNDFAPGKAKFILEANYKDPSFGKDLIDRMRTANPQAEYTGGRTWLLYQAVTGYELFTGEKPDLAKMSDVL